jgi:hypothetical protein
MSFYPFNSYEGMLEAIRRDQEAADSRVKPWQALIKVGQYFIRQADGIPIYGQVLGEKRKPKNLKNYRFTKCYSVICPEGEKGEIHISTIEKILSKEQFLAARRRGWG